jgi:DNA recombination protein RmuC
MSDPIWLLVGLAVGASAGLAIGWLFAQRRAPAHETQLLQLKDELAAAKGAQAAAESSRAEAEKFHEMAIGQLRDAFRAMSTETLQKMHPEFLRLAQETFAKFQESARGDLEKKEQAIATLVKPLEEHLKMYQQRLQQSETQQAGAMGAVRKHLETLAAQSSTLSQETQQLRRILSSNQARGRWGEQTLRRVVEAAGLSAHCDFFEQTQLGDGKPDMVIQLPGDRCIIVDAKVPDLDFLNGLEADPATRAAALTAHAAKLKATIRALAEREYPRQFPKALDYVVMFLPAESLFSTALEADQDLLVWAASKQILVTTPASLIGLLHCVQVTWQQHAQTENARLIAQCAGELYSRIYTFIKYFQRVGGGLEQANRAFNEAIASYESRLRPQGERLAALGLEVAGKELPEIEPAEVSLRTFRANGTALEPGLVQTASSP